MKSALIAMSGGVDSSVAAYLMTKNGYDCVGCTMRLYENDIVGMDLLDTCCSIENTKDARAVCERIGIPYNIYHYENVFKEEVIDPFIDSYVRGCTPNPCIDCNKKLKFHHLFSKMTELGLDYIVTGHYGIVEETDNGFVLKKAVDDSKDQSYVLYNFTQEQLKHIKLPLGSMHKTEIRAIAESQGFVNANKPDSQDICFVPDGDYASVVDRFNKNYAKGDFVDIKSGKSYGPNKGIIHYTIGQRKGLGIAAERPLYVVKIDAISGDVFLGDNEDLFYKDMKVKEMNWISGEVPKEDVRCQIKIRYKAKPQWATVHSISDDKIEVQFDEPQRAITPGQSAVLYDGDIVLGGGIIE